MKNIIFKLVKIANEMDAVGMHAEADEVTKVAKDIQEDDERQAAGTIELNRDLLQKSKGATQVVQNANDAIKDTQYQRSRI
jgi:hypothetical protein